MVGGIIINILNIVGPTVLHLIARNSAFSLSHSQPSPQSSPITSPHLSLFTSIVFALSLISNDPTPLLPTTTKESQIKNITPTFRSEVHHIKDHHIKRKKKKLPTQRKKKNRID